MKKFKYRFSKMEKAKEYRQEQAASARVTFERLCPKNEVKKVNLSLCLTNLALHHEDVWGSGCIDPYFLDLGTSSASRPGRFTPAETVPGIH
jgi:hypothetical protein